MFSFLENLTAHTSSLAMFAVYGMTAGLLASIPPGPSSMAVLKSLYISRSRAFKSSFEVLAADFIISLSCFLVFRPFASISENSWISFGAGLFLIVFAVRSWKRCHCADKKGSAFKVTISNPGCWLFMIGMITLCSRSVQSTFLAISLFLIAFELGVLLWYSVLITAAARLSRRFHLIALKAALIVIAMIGLGFVLESTHELIAEHLGMEIGGNKVAGHQHQNPQN